MIHTGSPPKRTRATGPRSRRRARKPWNASPRGRSTAKSKPSSAAAFVACIPLVSRNPPGFVDPSRPALAQTERIASYHTGYTDGRGAGAAPVGEGTRDEDPPLLRLQEPLRVPRAGGDVPAPGGARRRRRVAPLHARHPLVPGPRGARRGGPRRGGRAERAPVAPGPLRLHGLPARGAAPRARDPRAAPDLRQLDRAHRLPLRTRARCVPRLPRARLRALLAPRARDRGPGADRLRARGERHRRRRVPRVPGRPGPRGAREDPGGGRGARGLRRAGLPRRRGALLGKRADPPPARAARGRAARALTRVDRGATPWEERRYFPPGGRYVTLFFAA